jgi:hypothetical protein
VPLQPVSQFDLFFLSYDEPNAEKHWASLLDMAPWAKRVQKVLGFDAVHRAAAQQSETDWFLTVDADNMVKPSFFDQQVDIDETRPNLTLTWDGENALNGLIYGNGGIKLWSRNFALTMNCHELADDPAKAVDFCWLPDYEHRPGCWSEVWPNGSPEQAYRAGFREGVKLALDRGHRVPARDMAKRLHQNNLRNLRVWCCVGADRDHGAYAMLGAREGWLAACDANWDHTVIRDYGWFVTHWNERFGYPLPDAEQMDFMLTSAGKDIERRTGIAVPALDKTQSEFFRSAMRIRNG